MKLFEHGKDGGPESYVEGYWLVEIKWLFSIALLKFSNGSRESYHDHAFHAVSWLLTGKLVEESLSGAVIEHVPSPLPILTKRSMFHRVFSVGTSWVLTFRGPWSKTWHEYDPYGSFKTTLSHGRKVVDRKCE